jgi:hypothetical protein
MLVGYMRVSSEGDRQVLDLQRDALLTASVDEHHLFEDYASGIRGGGSSCRCLAHLNVSASASATRRGERCSIG